LIQNTNTDSASQGKTIFLLHEKYKNFSIDTINIIPKKEQNFTQTFIQGASTDFQIKPVEKNFNGWIVYVLLVLVFFISLIWYYLPERALSLIKYTDKSRDFHTRENVNTETPGILILLFFIINYFIALTLFFFLSIKDINITPDKFIRNEYLLFFLTGVIGFYLYRLIVIYFTGFIFNTKLVAIKQIKLYINVDNLTGVLLIPLLFLLLFNRIDFFFYTGLFIMIAFQIFKWVRSFVLGKSIPGFSILHLFMYLCTLEILPLIVLIKLFYVVLN
jgi:Domain of unknown function (DUF4271)